MSPAPGGQTPPRKFYRDKLPDDKAFFSIAPLSLYESAYWISDFPGSPGLGGLWEPGDPG
jgi:hypothetical protein